MVTVKAKVVVVEWLVTCIPQLPVGSLQKCNHILTGIDAIFWSIAFQFLSSPLSPSFFPSSAVHFFDVAFTAQPSFASCWWEESHIHVWAWAISLGHLQTCVYQLASWVGRDGGGQTPGSETHLPGKVPQWVCQALWWVLFHFFLLFCKLLGYFSEQWGLCNGQLRIISWKWYLVFS